MVKGNSLSIVEVVWDDAHGSAIDQVTLHEVAAVHRPTVMQTLGWLMREDEGGVTIANERCLDLGDETYRGVTFIPRSLVRSVTVVKAARKVRPKPATEQPT